MCMFLLLGLLPEELLGLRVVHQDLRQVLLVQDEEVGEAMRLDVGSASVPSTSCKQTAEGKRRATELCKMNCFFRGGEIIWFEA